MFARAKSTTLLMTAAMLPQAIAQNSPANCTAINGTLPQACVSDESTSRVTSIAIATTFFVLLIALIVVFGGLIKKNQSKAEASPARNNTWNGATFHAAGLADDPSAPTGAALNTTLLIDLNPTDPTPL